jgi:hypothetical protein
MGQIPQTKRLVTEDFDGQQEWIGKLIDPLNSFMQETVQLVNQSLTFSENFNGAILSIVWTGSAKSVAWRLKAKPVAAWLGSIREHPSNAVPTGLSAFNLVWDFTQAGEFRLVEVPGLSASASNPYKLTIVAVAG